MSKGQLFILTSIIVIIVLVLLKTSLSLVKVLENKRYLEAGLETLELRNIEDEVFKAIQIGYLQKENITGNVNNFTSFVRSSLSTRMIDLNGIFVESIYSNSSQLNTTVLNLLGKQIGFLNLTLNCSTPQSQTFSSLDDGMIVKTNFTFDSYGNYRLRLFYNTSSENKTEDIIISYENGKSKFVGFFDIRFLSSRGDYRDKFTETVDVT